MPPMVRCQPKRTPLKLAEIIDAQAQGFGAARAGVLILRVWLEDRGDPRLRIRLVGNLNLDVDDPHAAAAASVDETLAYVRDWLERFAAAGGG